MKTIWNNRGVALFAVTALAVGLAVSLLASPAGSQKKNIVDTAVEAGSFNTLVKALNAADLTDALKGDGPHTVFAPTDEAFSQLPPGTLEDLMKPENKEKLAAILTYHVVPGQVMSEEAMQLTSAKTLNGKELNLSSENGQLKINGVATVTQADIRCSNGVIHVIDHVLMPE